MKKFGLTLLIAIAFSQIASAQKYMTRTGKVTFFSGTKIENIEAFNNEASAVLDSKSGSVLFVIPIKSFQFEKALMQDHFNEDYMQSSTFPKAQFKGALVNPAAVNYKKDGKYPVEVSGQMTIHGVTKALKTKGTITVSGANVTINANFNVSPADYGIKIPSVAAQKIANSIEVTVESLLKQIP